MKKFILLAICCAYCASIYAGDSIATDSVQKYKVGLDEVSVYGKYYIHSDAKSPQMGMTKLQGSLIKRIPTIFGEPDVIKALHTQPGVSSGVEGFSGLYVRGGNGDENLITLDGIPLYQVTHLGGLFSTFNTEIIKDATFYKSAFPASYGGRLSSVVDISTKEACDTAFHGSAMLGLTSGAVSIGGPIVKEKLSFLFSVRRSWLDVISIPTLAIMNSIKKKDGEASIGQYSFTDINLRLDYKHSHKSRIALNLYWGNDYLKYGSKTFQQPGEEPYEKKNIDKLKWGNLLISSSWKYNYSPIFSHNITLAFTDYKSSNEMEISSIESDESNNTHTNKLSKNGISDITLRADWKLNLPNIRIDYGANYIYHRYSPYYYRLINQKSDNRIDSTYSDMHLNAHEFATYADAQWQPCEWGVLTAGLRFVGFNINKSMKWSLEPRVSAQIKFTDYASFKMSYTRMRQFSQQISDSYISLPTDLWVPVDNNRKPAMADQLSAGIYYDLKNEYSFSLEGYYKWIDYIADIKTGYSNINSYQGVINKLAFGRGRSYGIDMAIYKNYGKLSGWIGYSLLWSYRTIPGINEGLEYPTKFDNRHKFNIVLNYQFKKNIEFNAAWTFMTGNRATLPLYKYLTPGGAGFPPSIAPEDGDSNSGLNYYEAKNNFRLPAYHRLDLSVNIYQPKKNGRMGIWSIGLYNAYCQMNPIAITQKNMHSQNPTDGKSWDTSYQTIALFPVIPSVSYTYKF